MILRALCALPLCVAASTALATSCAEWGLTGQRPWVAYGGATMQAGQDTINPPASSNGLRGEASLPYTVPAGSILFLEEVFLEGLWGLDGAPFFSPTPVLTQPAVYDGYTVGPFITDAEAGDTPFNKRLETPPPWHVGAQVPAGITVNLWLRPAQGGPQPKPGNPNAWNYQWRMSGLLCSAPPTACTLQDVQAGTVC